MEWKSWRVIRTHRRVFNLDVSKSCCFSALWNKFETNVFPSKIKLLWNCKHCSFIELSNLIVSNAVIFKSRIYPSREGTTLRCHSRASHEFKWKHWHHEIAVEALAGAQARNWSIRLQYALLVFFNYSYRHGEITIQSGVRLTKEI